MIYKKTLNNSIYPKQAIDIARKEFSEFCEFNLITIDFDSLELTIKVKNQFNKNAREVILEFWNFTFDRACQIHLNKS